MERLLKLAHAGKLTAPEDVTKTEHPISDAIESHEKDNRRVDKVRYYSTRMLYYYYANLS